MGKVDKVAKSSGDESAQAPPALSNDVKGEPLAKFFAALGLRLAFSKMVVTIGKRHGQTDRAMAEAFTASDNATKAKFEEADIY